MVIYVDMFVSIYKRDGVAKKLQPSADRKKS